MFPPNAGGLKCPGVFYERVRWFSNRPFTVIFEPPPAFRVSYLRSQALRTAENHCSKS